MVKKLKTKPVILLKLELSSPASIREIRDFLKEELIDRGVMLGSGPYVKKVIVRSVDFD